MDVQAALVEEYAWGKGWCHAEHPTAAIPPLPVGDIMSRQQIDKLQSELLLYDHSKSIRRIEAPPPSSRSIRLAFFITAYKEPTLVIRLLRRLYSPRHIYVIHVDASYPDVFANITEAASLIGRNVHVVSVLHVVYMASSATQLVARAMMWYLLQQQHQQTQQGGHGKAVRWHYFITCTGSDYPLLPLRVMEELLAAQRPPMPRIMNWSPSTWKHAYQQARQSPESSVVRDAINLLERRGSNAPATRRATEQMGLPLTCGGQKSYVRLNARVQAPRTGRVGRDGEDSEVICRVCCGCAYVEVLLKMVNTHVTNLPVDDICGVVQWLFGRSNRKDRIGLVNAEWDASFSSLPQDGVFRVWCKSDPGTTAVYDYESVNYIVNSIEGRKYYHFFRHMLLGSEEHYFITLLANWQRTQAFVNTYDAQSVWNSWLVGSLSPNSSDDIVGRCSTSKRRPGAVRTPHVSYVTPCEMDILMGLSQRGVFFARKFSLGRVDVLDAIDAAILENVSFPAGEILLHPMRYAVNDTSGKTYTRRSRGAGAAAAVGGGALTDRIGSSRSRGGRSFHTSGLSSPRASSSRSSGSGYKKTDYKSR